MPYSSTRQRSDLPTPTLLSLHVGPEVRAERSPKPYSPTTLTGHDKGTPHTSQQVYCAIKRTLLGAIYPENVKAVVGSVPRVVVRQEISFGRPSRHPRLLWTLGGKLK